MNAEHYSDPTADTAIRNVMKEIGKMTYDETKTGEIWTIAMKDGSEKEVFVLKDNDYSCITFQLNDNEQRQFDVAIKCHGIKHINCSMPSYTFATNFSDFVRVADEDELRKIHETFLDALGMAYEEDIPEYEEPTSENCESIKVCQEEPVERKEVKLNMEQILELEKIKAERDIYKNLYKELIKEIMP